MSETILQVKNLTVEYRTTRGPVHAARAVTFDIAAGESMGLVGESGCGKTTVALALLRILPDNGAIVGGTIELDGADLAALSEREMVAHRWRDISMIFQAAMNSLNPVYRVVDQIVEAIQAHEPLSTSDARDRAADLFQVVGLDSALLGRYPHEYSGGMRQRAVIAMALACSPKVVIADEPTTALDVLVQERILREMRRIQKERQMGMLYISHDVAVIAGVSDTVGVMYAGQLVEKGPVNDVFARPVHPYTKALLESIPSVRGPRRTLHALAGDPPDLMELPPGCPFEPRCPRAVDQCRAQPPPVAGDDRHWGLCWNPVPTEVHAQ